jgi:hypothetical protein
MVHLLEMYVATLPFWHQGRNPVAPLNGVEIE